MIVLSSCRKCPVILSWRHMFLKSHLKIHANKTRQSLQKCNFSIFQKHTVQRETQESVSELKGHYCLRTKSKLQKITGLCKECLSSGAREAFYITINVTLNGILYLLDPLSWLAFRIKELWGQPLKSKSYYNCQKSFDNFSILNCKNSLTDNYFVQIVFSYSCFWEFCHFTLSLEAAIASEPRSEQKQTFCSQRQ